MKIYPRIWKLQVEIDFYNILTLYYKTHTKMIKRKTAKIVKRNVELRAIIAKYEREDRVSTG